MTSNRHNVGQKKSLTNSDVLKALRNLPKEQPFGQAEETETKELLLVVYKQLHRQFGKTTSSSQAHRAMITQLPSLVVIPSFDHDFPKFEKSPWLFWEGTVKKLPPYGSQPMKDRAAIFLTGAAQLASNIEDQLILRRFVAISAYHLFLQAFPRKDNIGSRIYTSNIKKFLALLGLPQEDADITTYGDIIRRGRRQKSFCLKLKNDDSFHNDSEDFPAINDRTGNQAVVDYGPLLFSGIPDSLWEPGSLRGNDTDAVLQHLRQLRTSSSAAEAKAKGMAKTLLEYHARLVFVVHESPDTPSNKNKRPRIDELPTTQREPEPELESSTDPSGNMFILPDLDGHFQLDDLEGAGPYVDLHDFDVIYS